MDYTEMAHAEVLLGSGETDPATWDELRVRDALVELKALDQERERLAKLAEQIVERYMSRREDLQRRADAIRTSVQTYIERFNGGEKLSFPDVGTAYLTTRKPKVDVTDWDAFEVYLGDLERGHELIQYKPSVPDVRRTLELFLDDLGYEVTKDGKVVDQNGEVVTDLPGLEVKPEGKTLAVRGA